MESAQKVLLYEVLEPYLDSILTHEKLEELSDALLDALDQIEPAYETISAPFPENGT